MQILLLTNKSISSEQFQTILKYDKSLIQNILIVNYSSLYEKEQFIYAQECMVVNGEKLLQNVLLSPSIVIDLTHSSDYSHLEGYLKTCWINAQQAFYEREKLKKTEQTIIDLSQSTKLSNCICYIHNNESPTFKIIEESINLNSHSNTLTPFNTIGLIEQAITEYFADKNFFSQLEWSRNSTISNHQSMIFFIKFEILQRYGDYTIENIDFKPLSFEQLLTYNETFVFNYFDDLLEYRLTRYIEQVKFRTHIIKLCDEYKIDLEPSYYKTFVLTKGKHIGLQRTYYGALNSKKGISIINDKHKTNLFLRENGFNANQSYEYTLDDLLDKNLFDNIPLNYPLTLKPTDKKEGYGVITNIQNSKRMLVSIKKLIKFEDIESVLVEDFFQGVTYRILVVGAEVVAVLKFIPANILGDGETAIDDLIRTKNIVSKSRIRINNALRLSIYNDGKTWNTILPKDEKYIISHNSHASTGGQSTNVTEIFNDKYKKIASDVCKSLELKIAGIDMIINSEGDYRIIEINCGPALATHLNPKHGLSIDTYTMILKCLLEQTDLENEQNSYLKELVPYHH
jgi:D-alanine-D-alanine ligase-like ATP-grasp enzyme